MGPTEQPPRNDSSSRIHVLEEINDDLAFAYNVGKGRGSRTSAPRRRPSLEMIEDRVVLSTLSSIASNFNGTAIPANDSVWFSSVAKVQGLGSRRSPLRIDDQTITFTSNGVPQTLSVPDAVLTLSPRAATATTSFNAGADTWQTTAPANLSGNVFLDGLSFRPVGGLPEGIKNVTWTGQLLDRHRPGSRSTGSGRRRCTPSSARDTASLEVKPVDDGRLSTYQNSDHAGTPESFQAFVIGGACGGGGSNFTGSYSATATVTPDVETRAAGQPVGLRCRAGGVALSGVVVTLTGIDSRSNPVTLTTTTDARGFYIFTGLQAGTYTIERPQPAGLFPNQSTAGTVDGSTDGAVL